MNFKRITVDPRLLGSAGKIGAAVWLVLYVLPRRYPETHWTGGITDSEIAAHLGVSENIVASWRANLCRLEILTAEAGENGEWKYYVDRGAWHGQL